MAIDSLRDGFVRLCFDTSANAVDDKCRLVIEGQYRGTSLAQSVEPNQLYQVTSDADLSNKFGAQSPLTEALKVALSCCGNNAVDIYALPRGAPVAGVAAVYRINVTSAATTDGYIDIYMGEAAYNISVKVYAGDTATDIAAAIASAINEDFPYTVTYVAGTRNVDLVARVNGEIGNHLTIINNWHDKANYAPDETTITISQLIEGEGFNVFDDYEAIYQDCCVCCHVLLSESEEWQQNLSDYLDSKWDCSAPQCFGHGYTYNTGTLGQILATDINSATLSKMAHCTSDDVESGAPILPYLKAAAYGALSCCTTQDNPELSVQGLNYGVLECVTAPETCHSCFDWDEQEQLRDAGFVVTTPVSGGSGGLTSPVITNDITNRRYDDSGTENYTFRSVSARRLASVTAGEIAEQLQAFQGLGYYTNNTAIQSGTIGANKKMILGQMRAWAKSKVGELFSQFDNIDEDITITDDFDTAPRCQGVPGKLALNFEYRPPVRLNKVVVTATPKLLDNC